MSRPGVKIARSIFVAYPYGVFPRDDYRRVFTAVEKDFDVAFVFADTKITNSHIFDKITEQIRESVFGLYDVSAWNPNVALELGYALGTGKTSFILMDPSKTTAGEPPSDLRGRDRINFGSLTELEGKLRDLLSEELQTVAYGTTMRLKHIETRKFLHSTGRHYNHSGSSHQQDVIAIESPNSLSDWIVRGPSGTTDDYELGKPVEHGHTVRFIHATTQGYLHSHLRPSPVSKQQEVTVFDAGHTDDNDNWRLELDLNGAWIKSDRLRLVHVATGHALHSHKDSFQSGEQEVTCYAERDANDYWLVSLG